MRDKLREAAKALCDEVTYTHGVVFGLQGTATPEEQAAQWDRLLKARSRLRAALVEEKPAAKGEEGRCPECDETRANGRGSVVQITATGMTYDAPCFHKFHDTPPPAAKGEAGRCPFHSRAWGVRCDLPQGHDDLCVSDGDAFHGSWIPDAPPPAPVSKDNAPARGEGRATPPPEGDGKEPPRE